MKLTRRGKIVLTIVVGLGVWGLWEVSSHLWWTGEGYCWGEWEVCGL